MAGVKISNLPAIVTPALTDIFPVVQSGTTYKETITQLAALLTTGGATPAGVQNQQYSYSVDSGAANAYVGIMSPAVTAYVAGQRFDLLIATNNTTASTLKINALATKPIILSNGAPLTAGYLLAGMIASFEYDGTSFQLLNPAKPVITAWASWTPTLTSAGTVPTFSTTEARYKVVNNVCFIKVLLQNVAGGTAGAGANALVMALPVSAAATDNQALASCGSYTNNTLSNTLGVQAGPSAGTLQMAKGVSGGATRTALMCADLNDANSREITFEFFYEV